ncbi:porphobilinogen synthase [Amylibacter marinus]|nr:porphobilinogen synthase [Amylibacter marinus]
MPFETAPFPMSRPRRLRQSDWMRRLISETQLSVNDLIWPLFITEGTNVKEEIPSMPGVYRYSIDLALEAVNEAANLDIPMVALFPHTDAALKTPSCDEAFNPDNLVSRATRAIKAAIPDIGVMLDVALDPYNSDGHDGIVRDGQILNDETLFALEKQALAHAEAGADVLGPSDMMDGRIAVIRQALEQNEFQNVSIMAYSAKFASAFYGPFRDAVGASGALKGDKKTYQLDPANSREAIQMVARDLAEGADMVMVKPGMPYLDICQRVNTEIGAPCFAYQVSGEYAMIAGAADNGWIDRNKAITESLLAFKRAGCSGILTYFAVEFANMQEDFL